MTWRVLAFAALAVAAGLGGALFLIVLEAVATAQKRYEDGKNPEGG